MDLSSGALWGAFGAIVFANILLSGDNAVVIAMAARSLPPDKQSKAIFWGSTAAIVMRVVLTIGAVELLQMPFLKIVGGLLLLWIGMQLLVESQDNGHIKAHVGMAAAIRTILMADLVMSIDNVLAVAGAADRAPQDYRLMLLIVGLGLSIPLIIAGSTVLMKVMDRLPVIVTLGAALLGFLAGEMFATDPSIAAWVHAHMPEADFILGGFGAILVVAGGMWMERRRRAGQPAQGPDREGGAYNSSPEGE